MKTITTTRPRIGPGYYQPEGCTFALPDAEADLEIARGAAVEFVAPKIETPIEGEQQQPEKRVVTAPEKRTVSPSTQPPAKKPPTKPKAPASQPQH